MGSRCSFVTIFCICAILVLGYGSCGNAQDAPTPTPTPTPTESSSSYPDTSTSTSTPTDSNISTTTPTSTSSSSASTSTSTSASTGSWFPWFPTTTTPVTTDYPTRPPTRPPTPPYDPYPYPTSRPTYAPTPSPSPYPYPYPDPIYPYPYPYPSYPTGTAYPTDLPDHGTYWPWDTPRGVLPTVQPASSSSLNPDYDSRSYYVVWAVSANDSAIANSTVPSTSSSSSLISLTVRESGDGIYFCARYSSWSGTRSFSLTGYNRAYYSNGVLEQSVRIDSIGFSRLLMQFSYLDSYNRIPKSGSNTATATWSSSSYYITARSRMGEFRMVNVRSGWYSDAADMYRACINERGKDGKVYWETVKMIANGQVQLQTSGSRGSALEHIGAFQWLESRFPSSSSSSSSYSDSYLLISWLSLSGIRLSRYHHYSWYDSTNANAAYDWNSWYNQMYPSTNNYYNYYNYGSNKPVIILYRNGAVVRSTYTNYNDFITLQQDYYSIVHSTTSAPTRSPYDPYPYPYPYPTPSPRYPYPSNSYPSFIFTRNWNDLSNAQRAFIIAYPIAIIGTGIILILITTCCIKSRNRRATSGAAAAAVAAPGGAPVTSIVSPTAAATSLSHRFHNLSTVGILLSLLSLVFLVVSLIVNRFSFATFGGTYTWASYGPFSTVQTSPWWGWLNMYWTGQVLGPTTAALIIFNILLQIANFIQLTNIKRSHNATTLALARASHPAMLTCACFIVSFTAVFVWFPIHVRLLDPALARMVIDNFNNSKSYYTYTPSFRVQMGASAILLIVATGVQLLAMIPMCRLLHLARQAQAQGQGQTQVPSMLLSVATVDYTRGGDQQSTSTSTRAQQAEQDGLQLVQIGSQYYYRAGPAPMATPYVYGVPTSGPVSYAPPVASAPPATASTYYPGYVPPSFQTLAAPIPTTSIAVPLPPTAASNSVPAPAPSVYPALPVEVPESGPNTRYQRLL